MFFKCHATFTLGLAKHLNAATSKEKGYVNTPVFINSGVNVFFKSVFELYLQNTRLLNAD